MSRPPEVTQRAQALAQALELGGEQLDPAVVQQAREVLERARERTALGGDRTVVALAGATGSGKSSLFNALVGADVATTGARRPTTSRATAAVWGSADATALLDWLGITRRHHVDPGPAPDDALEGLVLVDLPDMDSRELSHRVEADRVLSRVDVFVWVTDPQKYADARLHEDYLRPLRHHDSVTLVVLNQADRLRGNEVEPVREDLRRLVAADGAGDHEVIVTSARLRTGLDTVRDRIAAVVGARQAAGARLAADLRAAARALADDSERDASAAVPEPERLRRALSAAAGVPVVLDAVRRDHRRRAVARVGWPPLRWVQGLRPDPLRRLRLGDDTPGPTGIAPSQVRLALGRSSLPPPSPASRAQVALATREVADDAARDLSARWAEAVGHAAEPPQDTLVDALDQAVRAVPLRDRDPLWWSVAGALQLLLLGAAVVGLLWLLSLSVLGFLQVPLEVAGPSLGPVPVPTGLLAGGLLGGVLLALLGRAAATVGAGRQRRRVARRLDAAVDRVAQRQVRGPVAGVLDRHQEVQRLLARAAAAD